MSISTKPHQGERVRECKSVAQKTLDDCLLGAETLPDDRNGPLYDAHDALHERKLTPFEGGAYVSITDIEEGSSFGTLDDGFSASDLNPMKPVMGSFGLLVGAAQTQIINATERRGLTKRAATRLICKKTFDLKADQCIEDHANRDEAAKEVENIVREAASSKALQTAASNLGDCMESYSDTQKRLKQLYDDFVNSMSQPTNLGFAIEIPRDRGSGIEKGFTHASWEQPDAPNGQTGGEPYSSAELLKNWTGTGGEWYATLSPDGFRPAGIPKYSSATDKLILSPNELGSGEELDKNQYPIGWITILSNLMGQIELLLEGTVSQEEALSVKNNPTGAIAKGIIASKIIARTTETDTERAIQDADDGLAQAYQTVRTDSTIGKYAYNIVNNGGGFFYPGSHSDTSGAGHTTVPEGTDMSPTTPQALCSVCKTAANKLLGKGVVPDRQSLFLSTNLNGLCPLLEQIASDVNCIADNFEDILDEEEKIDNLIADVADEYDLDEDDPIVDEAIAAVANEGLTSDFFNRERVIFKEQCWLLSYIDSIAAYKKYNLDNPVKITDTVMVEKSAHKRLPYVTTADKYTADTSKSNDGNDKHNATLLVDGDPYGFLNQLVVPPTIHSLLDMKSHEISNLQPRIRLFKIEYDSNGDDAYEYEMPFDSHFTGLAETASGVKQFLKRGTRGVGVGIKSFNFVYDGTNPFSVKKSISANLKIFANNMNELLQERVAIDSRGGFTTFRYTDLAMKTGKSVQNDNAKVCTDLNKENTVRAPLNFRLKANVGWAKPITRGALSQNVFEALNDSYITINLTPTVHNFEIDEQGRVVMNINYLAYIDEFFDQSMFNIFANADMFNNEFGGQLLVATSRHIRDMRVETISKTCGQDEREDRIEKDADILQTEASNSLSFLITSLIARDKVYYVNLPFEKIRKFNQFGPYQQYDDTAKMIFNPDDATTSIILNSEANDAAAAEDIGAAMRHFQTAYGASGDAREEATDNITSSLVGINPNLNTLSFFYLSDLVDIILMNIDNELEKLPKELNERFLGPNRTLDPSSLYLTEGQIFEKQNIFKRTQKNFQNMRIILGPAELYTRRSKVNIRERLSVFVNLGDIPISIKYFLEFLTDKMLSKSKTSYSLTTFLNDLLNNLTRDFLNNDNCFGVSVKQKTRINQTAITAFGNKAAASDRIAMDPVTANILYRNGQKYSGEPIDNNFADRRIHRMHLPQPVLNVSGPPGSSITTVGLGSEFNCFVYYAARTQPTELMKGNKYQWTDNENVTHAGDHERGIFHYLLGRNRGLIKNIKLSKTETKGLAEARFETNGYDGLEQLRVVYDVEIDMYANVNAFPGTYIYIDPKGFAPNMPALSDESFDLTDLGIGGYYMIIRSEHAFGVGYANTKITAKWVHSIEKALELKECERIVNSEGDGSVKRATCKYFTDRKKSATDI